MSDILTFTVSCVRGLIEKLEGRGPEELWTGASREQRDGIARAQTALDRCRWDLLCTAEPCFNQGITLPAGLLEQARADVPTLMQEVQSLKTAAGVSVEQTVLRLRAALDAMVLLSNSVPAASGVLAAVEGGELVVTHLRPGQTWQEFVSERLSVRLAELEGLGEEGLWKGASDQMLADVSAAERKLHDCTRVLSVWEEPSLMEGYGELASVRLQRARDGKLALGEGVRDAKAAGRVNARAAICRLRDMAERRPAVSGSV